MAEEVDGVIEYIRVRNFFCHDNLEVNFNERNKNIHFIFGRNGSGKSAILTALVIGLGGRASTTNRGTKLQSFIKRGTNFATIEIRIKNSSIRAYKPELYKEHITVIRHLTFGSSRFTIKAATGEIISTKPEEVAAITLAHDIQVHNIISVMNQDDAKTFHKSSKTKKYSLFRQATNLDQTEANYNRALENCTKATEIWKRKSEVCENLEKEYKKWKTLYNKMLSLDEVEAEKQRLKQEYNWSEIAEAQRDADIIQEQCDKLRAKYQSLVNKLNSLEQTFGNNNEAINGLKSRLQENNAQKKSLEQELQALELTYREEQSHWRISQQAASRLTEQIARERKKAGHLEREISSLESGNGSSERAELEQKASEAARAAGEARARYQTLQHDAEQARAATTHARAEYERAQDAVRHHRAALQQKKQELHELRARGSSSLAVYGARMVELCKRVERAAAEGHFSDRPRGPVGHYLKLKEKRWGGAMEHLLGGAINSFCVNTPEDSRKLFKIMGQVYGNERKPSVTCSEFLSRRHNVTSDSVDAGSFCGALDMLQLDDVVVYNYLVDNLALETVLLVPEHRDAMRLASRQENVPMNCRKIVTLDRTEYHPAPGYRSYGGSGQDARYLHISTADRTNQLMLEIKEAERALVAYEKTANELKLQVERAQNDERRSADDLQAVLELLHRRESEERRVKDALERHHTRPQYVVLEAELKVVKEKLETLKEQEEKSLEQAQQCKSKYEEVEKNLKEIKSKLSHLTAASTSLREEMEREQIKMDQEKQNKQTYEQRVRESEDRMSRMDAILAEKTAAVVQREGEALQAGPRVTQPREKGVIADLLKKVELQLSSMSGTTLSREEVANRLQAADDAYKHTRDRLHKLEALINDIKNTATNNLEKCRELQVCISRQVRLAFSSILKLRGYNSYISIDHVEGEIDIELVEREGARRALASLSGGEQSYFTVAFIVALWDCVELPFYFMDEFDVFMDAVNRDTVIDLLLYTGVQRAPRQFVFLTPNQIHLAPHNNLAIHQMEDPNQ